MSTIKEAMLRNGVFLYDGMTIEGGFGQYMVVRDGSGTARYRIRNAELSNKLIVEDYYSGSLIRTIDAF